MLLSTAVLTTCTLNGVVGVLAQRPVEVGCKPEPELHLVTLTALMSNNNNLVTLTSAACTLTIGYLLVLALPLVDLVLNQ